MEFLGNYRSNIEIIFEKLEKENILRRIINKDYTVWKPDPAEITNRLGWLHSIQPMREVIPEIESLATDLKIEGYKNALLLGMGGSSLAPEVFRKIFGVKQGYLDLHVLDSTDPGMVLEYKNNLKPEDTLYIVSTKSGTTVETLSFMKYFFTEAVNVLGKEKAGQHFIAITDPGSKLVDMANDLKFRKIFLNDPEVGGRYSALTYFGLVPAALVGVDLEKLLSRAQTMADLKEKYETPAEGDISAARLGVIMGDLAAMGRDKLTLILSPDIEHFATWVEQLIAESTGKEGKGILPVVGEKILEPVFYAPDRLFVYIKMKNDSLYDPDIRKLINAGHPVVQLVLDDLYDLGREFFRWELATAIAGWRLGINPFDQPNVEAAKKLAKKMMQEYTKKGKLPAQQPVLHHNNMKIFADFTAESFMDLLKIFLEKAEQGIHRAKGRSYIAIQAYIKPEVQLEEAFQRMRTEIRRLMKMATTFGYGPRFLHSTGQLHKGDAGNGLFIQFTSEMPRDVPIPDEPGKSKSSFSFAVLKTAQQLGDQQALQEAGRNVIRIHLGGNPLEDIQQITRLLVDLKLH